MFWELYELTEKSFQAQSGKDLGIPIYFPRNKKKVLNVLQKPTVWERYGFPQNISMLQEFVHSQTSGIT